MALKISVHVDGMDAVKERLVKACSRAEYAVAVQIEKDTAPFVPALTGSLTQRTRVDERLVIYPGPYARYLYYGKLMVDPETGSPWAKKGATKVLTDRTLVFNHTVHPQAQSHWFEASKAQNLDKWIRVADKAVKKFGTE